MKVSQIPTLQVDGSFQPSESDVCLLNFRSSGGGVGCIPAKLGAPSQSECTVEVASRGYEQGDDISCGAADANCGAKTVMATITPLSVRNGWIFIVIAV